MSEKTKDGGTVGVIQANDSDIGINAALTYSLDVNDRSYFAMSSVDNQGRLSIFSVSQLHVLLHSRSATLHCFETQSTLYISESEFIPNH